MPEATTNQATHSARASAPWDDRRRVHRMASSPPQYAPTQNDEYVGQTNSDEPTVRAEAIPAPQPRAIDELGSRVESELRPAFRVVHGAPLPHNPTDVTRPLTVKQRHRQRNRTRCASRLVHFAVAERAQSGRYVPLQEAATSTQTSPETVVRSRWMCQHPRSSKRNPAPHSSPGRVYVLPAWGVGPKVNTPGRALGDS